MDKFSNLELHIKNMQDCCQMMQEKLLNAPNLTPDDIVELRKKQYEYQMCVQWLLNIRADISKILPVNGNGII